MNNNYRDNYRGYFEKRYGKGFSGKKIEEHKRKFYTRFKYIQKLINLYPEDKILEIGSGFGALYSFINNKNYIGLELDSGMVEFTNKFFGTDIFINKSLEDFETKKRFDKIFAIEVLEHMENPVLCIAKIRDLLNPRGTFIGTTPYPSQYGVLANDTHIFVLHPENWRRHFLNCGFKTVQIYPMSFIPVLWRINQHLNIVLPFYIPLSNVYSTCLIIAQK